MHHFLCLNTLKFARIFGRARSRNTLKFECRMVSRLRAAQVFHPPAPYSASFEHASVETITFRVGVLCAASCEFCQTSVVSLAYAVPSGLFHRHVPAIIDMLKKGKMEPLVPIPIISMVQVRLSISPFGACDIQFRPSSIYLLPFGNT